MLRNRQRKINLATVIRSFWAMLFVLALCVASSVPLAAQSTQITLLHISDTHSHLDAWGRKNTSLDGTLGGLPKAASIIANEKAADSEALFVHAGDFMEGDLFFRDYFGVPELNILKSLGLDAMTLGNHDFAYGPTVLAGVFHSAWPSGGVPVLGTNLNLSNSPSLSPLVTPAFTKTVHGLKVGFIALTARNAPRENLGTASDNVLISKYPATSVQPIVDALRTGGAQVVICLAHIGMNDSRVLAATVTGIDVIVNGHDNAVLEQPEKVGNTLIVSAGNYYRYVGRMRLSVNNNNQVTLLDYALLSVDANTPSLPWVQAQVDELKAGIVQRYGDVYHQQIATADPELTRDFDPDHAKRDTALGNLFTDAYRTWTGTDIAIEASGWLGDPIPAGPVVGADVFRAMSYTELVAGPASRPWRLFTFRATGADLLGALEMTLGFGGDYFPQVSGMRMDYNSAAKAGTKKILQDTVHINGHALVPDQLYSVATTEMTYYALLQLGLKTQDLQKSTVSAFDAARLLVALRGNLGLQTSNRIRDVAVIPGNPKTKPEQ